MANGVNGANVVEYYYRNRKTDWSLISALVAIILGLVAYIWSDNRTITELKIKNTNLEFRNEMQKQILERRYAPDNPFVQEE